MRRKRRMWLSTLILLPLIGYVSVAAILFFAQTWLLFPASQVGGAGPLPPGAERLQLAIPSGDRLHGIRIPATDRSGQAPLLVLVFAGNASNAESAAEFLHSLLSEADVVAFHYRGYAPSTGTPGAAALQQDALLVHDYIRRRLRPARTVAIGLSVGSAIAAFLGANRPLDGLILVTPFDSLTELAADHYPWLPVRWLLRHRLEPASDLRGSDMPVALLAGGRDTLVPPGRTEALRRSIRNLVLAHTLDEAGHNDIYDHPDFRPAMRAAMSRIVSP